MDRKVNPVAVSWAIAVAAMQASAATTAAESTATGTDELDEVLVTAQFRSQSLQDTPLAITAVNAAMLEARSQTSIFDVANRAPNVTLATSTGGAGGAQSSSVTIRGIGQSDFNLAVEPGVGIYVDDVYHGTMYGSMFSLIDIDRVEILRGPQGTLSGKNSEGGAVKLFSKQPSAKRDGYIEATAGSFDHRMLRAGTNLTLVPDKLFLRLTGVADRQDGYVTRYDFRCKTGLQPDALGIVPSLDTGGDGGCRLGTEGGKDVVALRAALRFAPNGSFDDTLTVDDTRDRSEPAPLVLTHQGPWHGPGFNLLSSIGPNPVANFVAPPGSYYNYSTYCALYATPSQYCTKPQSNLDNTGISNVLNLNLDGGINIKSISAMRKLDQLSVQDGDGTPLNRQMQTWKVSYKQYSQELRVSGNLGEIANWTLGGYYFSSHALQGGRINLDEVLDNIAPLYVPTDFLFNDPVRTRSKSWFAHVEVRPLPRLTLTTGVRYTSDFKSYAFVRYFAGGYTPGPVDTAIAATNGAKSQFKGDRWDYRLTAAYEVAEDVNVYGQFATGFKGGGVNPRPFYVLQVQPFKQESVTSYEAGVKSRLFDRRLRLNVSLFKNDYKDIQLTLGQCPRFVPPGAPPSCFLPANVGDATIKGVEAEVDFEPVRDLQIDASASYLDFQYKSVDAATGVVLTDKPPYTPKTKVSMGVQYAFDIGGAGSITPRVDYQFQSEQYTAARNFPNGRIPAYGLANARITYRRADEDWEVGVAVTNLFDKYYPTTITDITPPQGSTDSRILIIPGRPREIAVNLKYKF